MKTLFYNYFKSFINKQFFAHASYKMSTENMCYEAKEIFNAAVNSVKPENLIAKAVGINQNFVEIQGKKFHIEKNAYVVGFGKAVLGMARALETKLKENIVSGIISIPEGLLSSSSINTSYDSSIQVYEGALNNIPDEKSLLAASKISELVGSLKETDVLFVLISGGGSALLPAPQNSISLQEKQKVIKLLSSKGASIEELNAVRKKLSLLKGGGLAKLAKPAKVISLILSDIINDPLSSIASGPTVKNDDAPDLPLRIIEKYNLKKEIPIPVLKVLEDSQRNDNEHDSCFSHVNNFIIGSNQVALEAAASESQNFHYDSIILTDSLVGKANYTGMKLISMITAALHHETELVYQICDELQFSENIPQMLLDFMSELKIKDNKLCILLGGETTVEVTGTGLGGRNQELALAAAIELNKNKPNRNIILLAAGTDGIDGPTSAAGAITTNCIVQLAEEQGLNPVQFLNNNDSFNFYSSLKNGQFHVKTGHTGTNVMDIIVILIK